MTPTELDAAPPRWLDFRNDSGEEIPAFGIIRLTGVALPETGVLVYTGAKPNTYGSQYSHAINSEAPVPDNGYGKCTLTFPAVALYDSTDGTPAFGEMWGPRDATWKLKKNTGGFFILGITNTDLKLVLVSQAPMLSFTGKTDASHNKGATGTISIYTGTLGSETDTTVNMTGVYNRWENILSGKWVRCEWNKGTSDWEIVPWECA